MEEINALPYNGYRVASTFSGGGGSSLGYRMGGFLVVWASEFIEAARQTYRANFPNTIIDPRDVRQVQPKDFLKATGLTVGELDILDGSPPCASFSTAGKRDKHWGEAKKYSDTVQRTDDLFFEFARLVKGLQPKVFIAENVSGLVKGRAKGYFKKILAALKDCGYDVAVRLLDAQWLGVPQQRQRIFFVGVRDDIGLPPVFPSPLPFRYSLGEAVPWVRKGLFGRNGWLSSERPSPTVSAQLPWSPNTSSQGLHIVEAETDIARFAIGREWDNLAPGKKSGKYLNLVRPALNRPCPTITSTGATLGAASVVHPTEKRKLSIEELKRICGFPDDFVLTGTFSQQWERAGRSVPPVMMSHIAATIRDEILAKIRRSS